MRGDNGETTLQAWREGAEIGCRERRNIGRQERKDKNLLKRMVKTLSLESVNHKNPAVSP